MSKSLIIKNILEEELERNSRMTKRYKKELEHLPRGSIVKRKIGNNEYCYLSYRENNKVISKYIGKINEIDISELQKELNKRKDIENILKKLKIEKDDIEKMLKV